MTDLSKHEPPPQPSDGDTWQLVITDMERRRQYGIDKYGQPLQPFDGRDNLIDLYQEILDVAVYARKGIAEGMITLGCHHEADCPHHCDLGHVTADEYAMLDGERIVLLAQNKALRRTLERLLAEGKITINDVREGESIEADIEQVMKEHHLGQA